MKQLLLIISFLFSTSLWAATLDITNTQFVKAERYHQFSAILTDDAGLRHDVTNETNFSAPGYASRANGEFYFSLPTFGSSNYSVTISASYVYDGLILSVTKVVMVDISPDSITLHLPFNARGGGATYSLRAYARYGVRQIDITRKGYWSAMYGSIVSSMGYYRTPTVRRAVTDYITFRYGMRTQSGYVTVYP